MTRRSFSIVVAFVFAAGSARAAETVESVQKKIAEKSKKVTSMTAKVHTVMDMTNPGYKMKTVSDGTYEYVLKGEQTLYRSETTSTSDTEIAGSKNITKSTQLAISDAQYVYSLTDTDGQKMATKMKVEKPTKVDQPFTALEETHTLRVLPDETVDGHPCWVIEATPKKPSMPGSKERYVSWYAQDTGWMVKNVSYGADGKPMMTTTYTDIKINPSIPGDRFVFKAPAGVTVQEMNTNR